LATIIYQKVTRVTSHPILQLVLKMSSSSANASGNVESTRKQQAQQPAFHKVM